MSCEPCDTYPEKRVKELIGPNGKTLLHILALDISAEDRIWCMTRPDVLTHQEQVQFAIYCARRSLPNFERQHPDDKRPREAVDAAEAWLSDPSEENRKRAESAEYAARSAAWSAKYAARSAAWSAEYAARSAAWSAKYAARSAALSAEYAASAALSAESAESAESAARQSQIEDLRKIIKARKK